MCYDCPSAPCALLDWCCARCRHRHCDKQLVIQSRSSARCTGGRSRSIIRRPLSSRLTTHRRPYQRTTCLGRRQPRPSPRAFTTQKRQHSAHARSTAAVRPPPACRRIPPPVRASLTAASYNPTPSRSREGYPALSTAQLPGAPRWSVARPPREKRREDPGREDHTRGAHVDAHAAPAAVPGLCRRARHREIPCRPLCASLGRPTVTSWWAIQAYQQHWYVSLLRFPVIEWLAIPLCLLGGARLPAPFTALGHGIC